MLLPTSRWRELRALSDYPVSGWNQSKHVPDWRVHCGGSVKNTSRRAAILGGRLFVMFAALASLVSCPWIFLTNNDPPTICNDDQGDQRCAAQCEEIIAPYRRALPAPSGTGAARCLQLGEQIGCACFSLIPGRSLDDLDAPAVDLERGDFFINDNQCGAVGRPGDCLHDPAAFPGCVADTEIGDFVCSIVCDDLDAARRDDADGREDIEVLGVECASRCECAVGFGGTCMVVFEDNFEALDEQGVTPFPFNDAAGCP